MTSRKFNTWLCGNKTSLTILCLLILASLTGCSNQVWNTTTSSYSDQSRDDADWDKGADRKPEAKTLFAMAKLLISQGRDNEAQFVLSQIVQEYPKFLAAYVELAELHLRHRRLDAAQQVLTRGLLASPDDPVLQNNLGMCALIGKDYQRALARFARASAVEPDNARYRANTALALGLAGRYEECLAVYEQILPPADAHYNLAVLCESRSDAERAAEEYSIAHELEEAAQAERNPRKDKSDAPADLAAEGENDEPADDLSQLAATSEQAHSDEPTGEGYVEPPLPTDLLDGLAVIADLRGYDDHVYEALSYPNELAVAVESLIATYRDEPTGPAVPLLLAEPQGESDLND